MNLSLSLSLTLTLMQHHAGPVYPVFDGLLTEFGQAFTHGFIHIGTVTRRVAQCRSSCPLHECSRCRAGGDEVNDMNCWQESATVQAFMKVRCRRPCRCLCV